MFHLKNEQQIKNSYYCECESLFILLLDMSCLNRRDEFTIIANDSKYESIKYSDFCKKPVQACSDQYHPELVSETDTKAVDEFISKIKPIMAQCTTAAKSVVSEWQKMDKLHDPFISGWTKYYFDNFKSGTNPDGTKKIAKDKKELEFALKIEYDGCVSNHMNGAYDKFSVNMSSLGIKPEKVSVGKIGSITNHPSPNKDSKKPSITIAENFCADKGALVADPTQGAVDHEKAFAGDPNQKGKPVDLSKRSKADIAMAKAVAQKSGCTPYRIPQKSMAEDVFHLVCSSLKSYAECFEALGGNKRASEAQCAAPIGLDPKMEFVIRPCCEKAYAETNFHDASELGGRVVPITKDLGSKKVMPSNQSDKTPFVNLTVIASPGGTLEPSGTQLIKKGTTVNFKVKNQQGYKLESITGCGVHKMSDIYQTAPLNSDCTVNTAFKFMNAPGAGLTIPKNEADKSMNPNTSKPPAPGGSTNSGGAVIPGVVNVPTGPTMPSSPGVHQPITMPKMGSPVPPGAPQMPSVPAATPPKPPMPGNPGNPSVPGAQMPGVGGASTPLAPAGVSTPSVQQMPGVGVQKMPVQRVQGQQKGQIGH